jgi:long-chain fatty acid transport protein
MSKHNRRKQFIRLLTATTLAGMCGPLWASAFQIMEQGGSGLGNAYAGSTSAAEDATTGFYNAAGLTRLCREQIAVSAIAILPHTKLKVTNAVATDGATALTPSTTRAKGRAVIPGLHYALPLRGGWSFGFNVVTPFGLKTKYSIDGPARYMSTRSELITYDLAPSLAYAFGNGLSIGAGPDFVYTHAKLDTRLGRGDPLTDGYREDSASHWGVGGHLGVLLEASDNTRIGVNYRSEVKVKPKGESVTLVPVGLGGGGIETRTNIRSSMRLPETAAISIFQQMNDCWAAMVDVQWTHWRKFKNLVINRADGHIVTQSENFKDSYRAALGLSYQFDDAWKFRTGVAHERSPVRDTNRNSRIPDSHRNWIGLGAQYRVLKCLTVDAGYAHLFFKRGSLNELAPTVTGAHQPGQTLTGRYRNRAGLLGLQLTWDIG